MNDLRTKSNLDLKFIWFALIAVVLIVLESQTAMLRSARVVISIPVKPLIEVAQMPAYVKTYYQNMFEERELLRELNQKLDEENKALREELIDLKNAADVNEWISELLHASETYQIPVISAKPTSIQLEPQAQKIVVDRGSTDRVVLGQPVIDHRGVIGQVTAISLNDSAVTLITDSTQSLSVRVRRSGIKAVVHGLGDSDKLRVSGLRSEQDVVIGDILVTTGFGEKYPVGYPVAEVISVERAKNTSFANVYAVPLAAHDPGYAVMLVWPKTELGSDEVPLVTLNDAIQE